MLGKSKVVKLARVVALFTAAAFCSGAWKPFPRSLVHSQGSYCVKGGIAVNPGWATGKRHLQRV
jgi:hypothetical protein